MVSELAEQNSSLVYECKLPNVFDIKVTNDEYEKIHTALSKCSSIVVDASEVSKITTPGVQMLISLSNYCVLHKINLVINKPSFAFEEAFTGIGISFNDIFKVQRRS